MMRGWIHRRCSRRFELSSSEARLAGAVFPRRQLLAIRDWLPRTCRLDAADWDEHQGRGALLTVARARHDLLPALDRRSAFKVAGGERFGGGIQVASSTRLST